MALIDSDNFIAHLIWSGLIDKATCGELKEAIELCTVKDVYTKADMVAMLEDLKQDIIAEAYGIETDCSDYVVNVADIDMVIQQKINSIKEDKNEIQC